VSEQFNPIPSREALKALAIDTATAPGDAQAIGVVVGSEGSVPAQLGVDREALTALDFDGKVGQALRMPRPRHPTLVAVGIGDAAPLDAAKVRDAAAAFGRATGRYTRLAFDLSELPGVPADVAAQAVVEGVILARYRYDALKSAPAPPALASLTLVADAAQAEAVSRGIARGRALAAAACLARDLANTPPAYLTARVFAQVAEAIGRESGLQVEIFDNDALAALGCGGLLGVNRGSTEPARMIKMTYTPADDETLQQAGHLGFVGKGLTYDSSGISLKPSNPVHATMKNDMSGGGAVVAAMSRTARTALSEPRHRLGDVYRQHAGRLGDGPGRRAHHLWRQDGRGDEHRRRRPPDHG
jgi:leucyl aminopeptidase